MNLVPKLSMAFLAGMSLILAVNGYRRVRREVALFESDRIRDDVQIGKTLAAAVTSVGRVDGQARALALVRDADAQEGRVRVRWVWLDAGLPARARPRDRARASPQGALSLVGERGPRGATLHFVPVA